MKSSSTVEKAIQILEAFDAHHRALTLTDLVEATGLEKTAVIRLSLTLQKLGYLRRNTRTKRFRLAPRVLSLTVAYLGQNPLVASALPRIQKLASQTGLQVELSELDGTESVIIASAAGRKKLSDVRSPPIGVREPAFVVSPGRAILAHLPREDVRRFLMESRRIKYTRHTNVELEEILRLLEEFVRAGHSWNDRGHNLARIGIGAPIFGFDQTPIAAISITADARELNIAEARRRFASAVMATAADITGAYLRIGP
ncbi:MAG: IclR family transcriptional regulator [Alphaproteobacteria bacterium]